MEVRYIDFDEILEVFYEKEVVFIEEDEEEDITEGEDNES